MKKVLALLLVFAMVLALAACGTDDSNDKGSDATATPAADDKNTGNNDGNNGENAGDNNDDGSNDGNTGAAGIEGYPADFNDWTAEDVVNYFAENVNFPSDTETWVQDHATYWAGMPVYEASGAWNVDGAADFMVMFLVFNPDSPDTTPEEVEAVKQAMRDDENHDYTTDDLFLGVQDHLVGNVAFSYGLYILDEDLYNEVEAAYNKLVEAYGLTPDF